MNPISVKNESIKSLIFLILSGFFLGSITLLNVRGTSQFIDYSFEIFKTYAGYPYAFKQFIYDIFLRKDPRIIEHQKADPSAFNEKKVNFFNEQD